MDMENNVTEILKELGVPCNLCGYRYIKEAVLMILEDENHLRGLTKTLHPGIAKKYKTTASKVERGIRHAIESSFMHIPQDVITKHFGNSIYTTGKPCNSHYLATIAEHIKTKTKWNGVNI